MMRAPLPHGGAPTRRPGHLHRFQDEFARAILAVDPDTGHTPELAGLVGQPGFAVYRNTVMKGCVDALQANYPSVAKLVGEEWFRAAAAIYARANPPSRPSLVDYGNGFAPFLADFEPAAELPYLPGVAHLDRFWTEVHIARDEAPVSAASIARLAPEQLARATLRPRAAARWAWFETHPVFTIWSQNREPGEPAGADQPPTEWRADGALLVRTAGTVTWQALGADRSAFLDACAAGGTLGEAAEAALATDPHTDLDELIAELLASGVFGHLSVPDDGNEEDTPWLSQQQT